MRKILLFPILCGLIFASFTAHAKVYKESEIRKCKNDEKLTCDLKGNLVSGIVTYYKDGKLEKETSYKNGKKNGVMKHYDEIGNLESEEFFKEGKSEGIEIGYYPNGALKRKKVIKDDQSTFTEIYDKNGKLKAIINGK